MNAATNRSVGVIAAIDTAIRAVNALLEAAGLQFVPIRLPVFWGSYRIWAALAASRDFSLS
jgi:hypothetical protein